LGGGGPGRSACRKRENGFGRHQKKISAENRQVSRPTNCSRTGEMIEPASQRNSRPESKKVVLCLVPLFHSLWQYLRRQDFSARVCSNGGTAEGRKKRKFLRETLLSSGGKPEGFAVDFALGVRGNASEKKREKRNGGKECMRGENCFLTPGAASFPSGV